MGRAAPEVARAPIDGVAASGRAEFPRASAGVLTAFGAVADDVCTSTRDGAISAATSVDGGAVSDAFAPASCALEAVAAGAACDKRRSTADALGGAPGATAVGDGGDAAGAGAAPVVLPAMVGGNDFAASTCRRGADGSSVAATPGFRRGFAVRSATLLRRRHLAFALDPLLREIR